MRVDIHVTWGASVGVANRRPLAKLREKIAIKSQPAGSSFRNRLVQVYKGDESKRDLHTHVCDSDSDIVISAASRARTVASHVDSLNLLYLI